MKTSLALAASLAVLLASSAASAANYKAVLNGAQETPPTGSAATATTKNLSYNAGNQTLTGEIDITGIPGANITAQHIHEEFCGSMGAVLYPLSPPNNNKIIINQVLSAADLTALNTNKLYINVHTTAHAGGEIRGQIFAEGSGLVCLGPNDGGGVAEAGSDAAVDSGGTSGSSGTSGTSGGTSGATSGGTSGATSGGTSGSNGATTTPSDDGGTGDTGGGDSGGCATAGTENTSSGIALAGLIGLAIAVVARSRKNDGKKKR